MLRLLLLVPFVALPWLAVACDGGAGASAATAAVQAAARATDAESARISVRLTGVHPTDGEFGGELLQGQIDFARDIAELQLASDPPATLLYTGGKVYQSWLDTPWWIVRDSERGGVLALEPTRMLEFVADADDVEVVGAETIEGTQATHYRFGITADDLSEAIRDTQKGLVGTVDVWISDDRVHRLVSAVEYEAGAADPGLAGQRFVTEIRLFDWGIDVQVSPPGADLLKTLEEIQELD